MRSKNAVKNLTLSLIYEVFIFIVGMVAPRFIILVYGSAINGLASTISRLLTLINLIQAGAVGSAIYQMYKPVASNDYEKQSSILFSSKRFYNKAGKIYLLIASVVAVIYGFYLQDNTISALEIIFAFLIMAVNGSIYLFYTSKFDIVFSAYQKKYLLLIGSMIEKVIYYTILVLVLTNKLHFICMYVAMTVGCLAGLLYNTIQYRRLTAGKISNNPIDKNYVIPDRKYLMATSITTEAITALPTILVTSFLGLIYSSVFSIYQMVYSSIKTIVNSTQLSVSAIFGNLVASENPNKIYKVHKLLELVFLMMGAFLASCTAFLLLPFIKLYTSGINDANYIYPVLASFVVCYIMIFAFRTSVGYVATVYGLFKDIFKITLIFGCGGMAISLTALIIFGLPYVMAGILFYELSSALITMKIVYQKVDWFTYKKLPQRALVLVLIPALFYLAGLLNVVTIESWITWIIAAIVAAAISFGLIFVYCCLFERAELWELKGYVASIIKKRKVH